MQGIKKPFQISLAQLRIHLEVCEEQNDYFRQHGARYRKKHLLARAETAKEEGREEAAVKILAIIKREQDRSFWRRLNYTCGKARTPPPTSVQVKGPSGTVTKHNTENREHCYLDGDPSKTISFGEGGASVPRTTSPRPGV